MNQKIAITVLVTVAMLVAMVAPETKKDEHKKVKHTKHGGQERHTKDGRDNVDFDHISILGSKTLEHEFDELDEEEAEHRLRLLAMKMDRNGDGHVDKDELTHWIIMSYDLLDKEDALDDFTEKIDKNEDKKVTWSEYLAHLNTTEKDVQRIRNKKNKTKEEESLLKEVQDDEKKFKAADTNKDGSLNIEEYFAFFHPETLSYKHMHKYVLEATLADHDKNKDGKFSFEEYIAFEEDADEEDKEKERKLEDMTDEQLTFDEYDLNKDGFLDKSELLPVLVTDHRVEAEAEAEHLIEQTDEDTDGQLSYGEIVEHVDIFTGHVVTGDGQYFHYVKRKDEL